MELKRPRVYALRQLAFALAIATGVAILPGCYVIPIGQYPANYPPATAQVIVPAPLPVTFSAWLYPANDLASAYGMINAVVTSDLHGRGSSNSTINGESFVGESTRQTSSSSDGLANGAGNRGSYINCQYTMDSATTSTGSCTLSHGAQFTMHVGQ